MSLKFLLMYLGYFILAINTFVYFKSYRNKTVAFKVISFYLLFCLILQLNVSYLNSQKEPNLFLSHYYFVGQFLFLSFFYLKVLKKTFQKKIIKFILIAVLSVLFIQYFYNPELYYKFNLLEIVLCSIPIVLYSFLYFLQNLDSYKKDFIYLNSGIFIYLLSSTLLFVAGNYVSTSVSFWNRFIWTFNASLYVVYQTLIFIDWYKNFRKS